MMSAPRGGDASNRMSHSSQRVIKDGSSPLLGKHVSVAIAEKPRFGPLFGVKAGFMLICLIIWHDANC